LRDRIIYTGEPFDTAAMRGMRERQVRQLTTSGCFNAKLSPGGLVDIEYLVQGLQITHGHRSLDLRDSNTLNALETLCRMGVITSRQSAVLRSAYLLLRRTISALRVVRGHSGDLAVPADESDEFAFLAHRMGYESNPAKLRDDLVAASSSVESLSRELLP
jgi:glutamate-ammonia-ligase adenylyltransferase